MALKLSRLHEVCRKVGLGRSTVYKLVAAGEFPAPVHPTPRTTAWIDEEVEHWLDQRIKVSRQRAAA